MLLEMNQWHLGYSQLLSDVRASPSSSDGRTSSPQSISQFGAATGGTILILVNPDVDALSAARIVTYALRADGVPYQLRPCGGYGQLVRILTKLSGDGRIGPAHSSKGGSDGGLEGVGGFGDDDENESDYEEDYNLPSGGGGGDIRAVVLLNLGANRNLTRLYRPNGLKKRPKANAGGQDDDEEDFDEPLNDADNDDDKYQPALLPPTTRLYVLDSHRPHHLSNIHSARSVVLFNDRAWDDDVPSDGDNLSGEEVTTDEDSDDSSDDSDEEEEEGPDLGEQDAEGSDAEVEFDDDGEVRGEGGRVDDDDDDESSPEDKDDYDADNDDNDPFDEDDDDDLLGEGRRKKKRRKTEQDGDAPQDDAQDGQQQQQEQDATPSTPPRDDDAAADDDSIAADRRELDAANHQQDQDDQDDEPPAATLADLRHQRRSRIRLYYASGSHHSSPVSWMAYTLLSTQLRYGSVGDLLWLACVGVTDSYLHGRIDKAGYATFAQDLRRHVRRVYPDDDVDRASGAAYAELLDGTGLSNTYNGPHTQLSLSENGKILTQNDEYRFYLLRHTSLWNAMLYSPYVCSKMQLWNGAGMGRWREMLAKMGLPLEQCQQPYAFMKPGLKRRLREVMNEHAEEFGLDGLSYTGFIRITGYRSLLSASDMSYAITALLECEASGNQAIGLDNADGTSSSEEEQEDIRLMHSFNAAYDALGSSNAGSVEGSDQTTLVNGGTIVGGDSGAASGLGGGIRLALSLQRAIIQTAIGLVDRKAITRLSHFRYAYIHCTSQGSGGGGFGADRPGAGPASGEKAAGVGSAEDEKAGQANIFAKPLVLTRLAHFLMDIHRANGKWAGTKSRPLVLLAEKPQTDTYVVVGYEFPESTGDVVRNRFGQNFDLAARTMNGTFKFDSFDSNVVEVRSSDVQRFVEQLHYMMESM